MICEMLAEKWVNHSKELEKTHTILYEVLYLATGSDHGDEGYCSGADADEDKSPMGDSEYEQEHVLYILTSEPIKKKKRFNFTNNSCSTKYGSHYCFSYSQHFVALDFKQVPKERKLCRFSTPSLRKYILCAFHS
jgi:hypothetical protein